MKRAYHIMIMAFLLFLAADVTAQEQGGVVMHTDPRLSVLMKKKRVVMQASATRVTSHISGDAHIPIGQPHMIAEATSHHGPAHPIAEVIHTPPATAHTTIESTHAVTNSKYKALPPPFIREREGRVIYSGKGYRVQIYNGPDRGKAIAVKAEFMRNNPGVRTYLTYVSPCFRVKVGNYRNRSDALGMLKEANSVYSPCVIVPDIITINTY